MKAKKLLTFREYSEFDMAGSDDKLKDVISYFDPTKGWVLDPNRIFKKKS
jgi:hypothetical protein